MRSAAFGNLAVGSSATVSEMTNFLGEDLVRIVVEIILSPGTMYCKTTVPALAALEVSHFLGSLMSGGSEVPSCGGVPSWEVAMRFQAPSYSDFLSFAINLRSLSFLLEPPPSS